MAGRRMVDELIDVEWRDLPCGHYAVSDHGDVKRIKKRRGARIGHILSQGDHLGYRVVNLCVDSKAKTHLVHRLVAKAFICEPSCDRPHVNHIDGDRSNNHVSNLEWVSVLENNVHAIKVLHRRSNAILDWDCVAEIRSRYSNGCVTQYSLADEYGVDQAVISDIVNYKRWVDGTKTNVVRFSEREWQHVAGEDP